MTRASLVQQITFAGVALFVGSCGYVGDPLPPALNIPNPVTDLRAQQVESHLEAAFTIPPDTTEKLPITSLAGAELRIGPGPAGPWKLLPVDATRPGPVDTVIDVREFAGQDVLLAVRLANRKGRSSAWSNLVTLHIEPPVLTPSTFVADSAPSGAILTWSGHTGPVIVYRDGAAIGEGANGQFNDPRALLGKSYKYEIQARGDKARGTKIGPVALTVVDRFPPAAPGGVIAVNGSGTVELSWDPNPENDILGYTVLRASGAEPFALAAKFVDAPAYTDRAVQRGARYRYKVTALDLRRNESPTSQEVEITVP